MFHKGKPSTTVIKIAYADSSAAPSVEVEVEVWGSCQGQEAELGSHRLALLPSSVRATVL